MNMVISIVGMACRYAESRNTTELWENVLAQRRSFRRLPEERFRLADYYSPNRSAADRTYCREAAVLDGYEFDRLRFKVAGGSFRATDLTHWLALDVASQALTDAGFDHGEGLPRRATGVLVGNTLAGEFSRAQLMRLRWPYVRRVVTATLAEEGWGDERLSGVLGRLEEVYKSPFPPVAEDTLAGGLANTIAGRICNHYDLMGGGYTVDGACASSLLAVSQACSHLAAGDLDVVLVGGVDLSLDPFELVGFAKVGALAEGDMRVFDAHPSGFLGGEGCGFVVLMRRSDALAAGRRIYASVRGWGVSSDGGGGLTRPGVEGQRLALERAYDRAGVGINQVGLFEAHGTGTRVGDATELAALQGALNDAGGDGFAAAIGSIKANIGHTKAASGVAGLLKATLALHHQILPPTTGCVDPHPKITADSGLRVLAQGEPWPAHRPLLAGVSGMGFGGINAHVVLEGAAEERKGGFSEAERTLISSAQDREILLFDGRDGAALGEKLESLLAVAPMLSRAELGDLAAELVQDLGGGPVRGAVVAQRPSDLVVGLEKIRGWLRNGIDQRIDLVGGAFLGNALTPPRCAFVFPGQGSSPQPGGGIWRRRFAALQHLFRDPTVALTASSVAGLRLLESLGIRAELAIGHSLGEFAALHWAGVWSEESLLRIASARGRAMDDLGATDGAMASLGVGRQEAEELLAGRSAVVAAFNSSQDTVVSGPAAEIEELVLWARSQGISAISLRVSHAFHSPWVEEVGPRLSEVLAAESFALPERPVISTVTGESLAPDDDLRSLLVHQVTQPVRFQQALESAAGEIDLWIEVGPGRALERLLQHAGLAPAVSLDVGGSSVAGLLSVVGASFAMGAPVAAEALFEGRFNRPFDRGRRRHFLVNPCELAPTTAEHHNQEGTDPGEFPEPAAAAVLAVAKGVEVDADSGADTSPDGALEPLELVTELVARRAELPVSSIRPQHRLLSDLHMTSLTVGLLLSEATQQLGLASPAASAEYADATVAQLAEALEEQIEGGSSGAGKQRERDPAGVDSWVRDFVVELVPRLRPRPPQGQGESVAEDDAPWHVVAVPGHPLKESLVASLPAETGGGVVLCLPENPDEQHVDLLLNAAKLILADVGADRPAPRFVVVQQGGGGGAFARTLHLEAPTVATTVVDVPFDHPESVEWVMAEVRATVGYLEAHYNAAGERFEPQLCLLTGQEAATDLPLGREDVLVATGGGKGIGAECALTLARASGAFLVVVGRSDPAVDEKLARNLGRLAAAKVRWRYVAADVTDAKSLQGALREVEREVGWVTAILHSSGINRPRLLGALDREAFCATLAPKLDGLRNLLAAVEPTRLRLLVTFGSIIARTGMRGEADYAVANEWLARMTEEFGRRHPECRCLALEWSVWAGAGMGERLSRLEALAQQGISPISLDQGTGALRRLIAQATSGAGAVVVAGRLGESPTLRRQQPELPLLRFLEHPRVFYAGVELVVEAELSIGSDPYLGDHVFKGECLFPAVLGLEAMCQVARALKGSSLPPVFEAVRFQQPVIVPRNGTVRIRLAALVQRGGEIEVVLRSAETAFGIDHFVARCRFEGGSSTTRAGALGCPQRGDALLPLDRETDLYDGLLFQRGRFRRVHGYRWLRATESVAEIADAESTAWFSHYLPGDLLLGDPGARDAVIHSIQASIPHADVLPVAVNRLETGVLKGGAPWSVAARERGRRGETLIYDVEVMAADGRVCERWHGLELRIVAQRPMPAAWALPLLGPYLERHLGQLFPETGISVMVAHAAHAERRAASDLALRALLSNGQEIHRRPDGKPEVLDDSGESTEASAQVSLAYTDNLVLAVAGSGAVGCDVEPVVARGAATWQRLLGESRFELTRQIVSSPGEDEQVTRTRVWAAAECLKKAGAGLDAPLVLASRIEDGWLSMRSGPLLISTLATQVQDHEHPLVFAVLGTLGKSSRTGAEES